jgi:hypothetical protein
MDPLAHRVAQRFTAAVKAPVNKADVQLREPIDPKALKILIEEGKKVDLNIVEGRSGQLQVTGPEGIKQKAMTQLFEKVWLRAGHLAREEGIPKHGLSYIYFPKLDFSRYTNRQQGTGRYIHTKETRLCKCGHPVGVHTAERGPDGSQPCISGDILHTICDCMKFRPTQKFLTDEEYEALYGRF